LAWIWLPLQNGNPPGSALNKDIELVFAEIEGELAKGAMFYIHCSAGTHRTGMIAYAFLRYIHFSREDAISHLHAMRAITGDGVGDHRLAWGDLVFGGRD
jgi:protein-tyrosine phosphatase